MAKESNNKPKENIKVDLLDERTENLIEIILESDTVVTSGEVSSVINSKKDLERNIKVLREVYYRRPFQLITYEIEWAPEVKTKFIQNKEKKTHEYLNKDGR